ncbi:hypothetical protein [Arcicella rigui]|uniref:DUF1349 domain-containing protein n=1 Tax=Arcicella rigui TaxID=797020 RepID=A0ABU5QCC7_9BACT|nr:hypothetical protein [Arcicella rigui]MEA5140504.1 hypothetical protein [Arcicella rigui]
MNEQLTFSKDFWSSTYEVKDGSQVLVRTEKKSIWSYDSNVRIGDKEYFFDVTGLLADTIIIYENKDKVIGNININFWNTEAKIFLENEGNFLFKQIGLMSSEWELQNEEGLMIHFSKNLFTNDGTIKIYQENNKCLAVGIFLISIYQQKRNNM